MYGFDYLKAASVADAANRLAADEDAKLLAGGMTLLPTLRQRLAMPSALIDLNSVAGLDAIVDIKSQLRVGAMARHADVAASAVVNKALPALARLAAGIGDVQVRHRGTLGGSIANNDPAADYPAALLALNAQVITNRRSIAAGDFFTGMFETALGQDEIIVAVEFPALMRAAYAKFRHPASRYAITGVFIADHGDGDIKVAVTGAAPCVFRWQAAEQALAKHFEPGALGALQLPSEGLNSDLHADAAYRAHLTKIMAERAVAMVKKA
ncbi:MAG: xanthine dehydrogenase family protein subunit M [Sphingomonadales bacterium]